MKNTIKLPNQPELALWWYYHNPSTNCFFIDKQTSKDVGNINVLLINNFGEKWNHFIGQLLDYAPHLINLNDIVNAEGIAFRGTLSEIQISNSSLSYHFEVAQTSFSLIGGSDV